MVDTTGNAAETPIDPRSFEAGVALDARYLVECVTADRRPSAVARRWSHRSLLEAHWPTDGSDERV